MRMGQKASGPRAIPALADAPAAANGCTVIIIAHRLSAVCDANRILVLDHGEVVEDGAHAELVKRPDGKYAHLYALQAG